MVLTRSQRQIQEQPTKLLCLDRRGLPVSEQENASRCGPQAEGHPRLNECKNTRTSKDQADTGKWYLDAMMTLYEESV